MSYSICIILSTSCFIFSGLLPVAYAGLRARNIYWGHHINKSEKKLLIPNIDNKGSWNSKPLN